MSLERWAGLHGGRRTEEVTPWGAVAAPSTEKHSCPERCSSASFSPQLLRVLTVRAAAVTQRGGLGLRPLSALDRHTREAEPHVFARGPGMGSVRGGRTLCRRHLRTDIAPGPGDCRTSQGAWTKGST